MCGASKARTSGLSAATPPPTPSSRTFGTRRLLPSATLRPQCMLTWSCCRVAASLACVVLMPAQVSAVSPTSVAVGIWRNRGQRRIAAVGAVPFSMLERDSSAVGFLHHSMRCCNGARIAYLEKGMPKLWNTYALMREVWSADSCAAAASGARQQLAASSPLPAPRVSGRRMQE